MDEKQQENKTIVAAQETGMAARHKVIANNLVLISDAQLKDAITNHANYIDLEGKGATSPGGFMIQINKHIKHDFGCDRKEMDGTMHQHCGMLLGRIAQVITSMEALKNTRADIKLKVYALISLSASYYLELIS